VLFVDEKATGRERAALSAFAKHMGGRLLENVERVVVAPISLEVGEHHSGAATLRAGRFATVETRGLNDGDHLCGNEETFYPPLTETTHAMPVVAVTDSYQGPGLGERGATATRGARSSAPSRADVPLSVRKGPGPWTRPLRSLEKAGQVRGARAAGRPTA